MLKLFSSATFVIAYNDGGMLTILSFNYQFLFFRT